MRLLNVEPYSVVFVNWTFTVDGDSEPEIRVLDSVDLKLNKTKKIKVVQADGQVTLSLAAQLTDDDTYLVEFVNNDPPGQAVAGSVFSTLYSSIGGAKKTWIHSKLNGSEYVITSSAAGVTGATGEEAAAPVVLRAFVRQLPGVHPDNTSLTQMVVMESFRRLEELIE